MPGDTSGVWGRAQDTGDSPGVLGTPMNRTHGRGVVWGGMYSNTWGHVERPRLTYDIKYRGGCSVESLAWGGLRPRGC